ncbi:CopG family ribbon-helix-helix protein [Erwinia sp. SLM-02]|uniref:CopG family ribbon-helix-helix protein n=1 Tax=Erwinia sp. SLM-02 TaxID=3020057 RepID=UPI00308069AE
MIRIESHYESSIMGQTKTRAITACVTLEMAEKLDRIAADYSCSQEWLIKQALQDLIDQEEQRHQMTLEALAAVDEGRVVAHDDVMKWATSLGTEKPLSVPKSGKQ